MSTFDAVYVENSHRRAFLHKRWLHVGAADEARTRYLHLGKVALYQMSYGRRYGTSLYQAGPPRKLANARFCGEEEKFQCLSRRSCFARLPDKRLTFRRGASDRNRTNDTGIFSPLLYRLSYRGIESAFIPALPRIRFLNRGPRKNLRSKCLWGRGESLAFITAVLLARLPDEPQDFRRATRIGLEPTTPSVTGWCSNQLSYRATWWKLTDSNR